MRSVGARVVVGLAFVGLLGAAGCPAPSVEPPPPPPASTSFGFAASDALTPVGRWGFLAAPFAGGAVIFGGTDIDLQAGTGRVLDEVWRLDATSARPSFQEVAHDAGPNPRYCGCAAVDLARNELVVLGGRADVAIHEAWVLDMTAGHWTQVQGDVPAGSVGCSLVFAGGTDTAYAFGGGSDTRSFDETWRFDGVQHTFTKLDATGPSARYDQALKSASDGSALFLVGGAANAFQGFSAQVWRFDTTAQAWTMLSDNVSGGPSGRRTPWTALADDGAALLVGFGVNGMDANSDLADLWAFDLATNTWSAAEVDGALPPARGFSQWLPGPPGTAGMLYAGTDMAHTLDDAWLLTAPDGTAWH